MRISRWIWVLAGVAALLVVVKPGRSPDLREVGLPPELVGVWTTEDDRYADRFLEIARDEIVFGQGEAGEERRRLVGVFLAETPPEGPLYVLRYRVDGGGEPFATLRVRLHRDVLRLESQPEIVWTR